jgi:S-adenosylmethionine-diacylglycerol 3-amino-3-carboxypropyl transferase
VDVRNETFTRFLSNTAANTKHGYVLLDAQDWMTNEQLNELWGQITRTAAPGARVIFRTAGIPTILPGRVDDSILSHWEYLSETSTKLNKQDRSAIYGGFHIYKLKDN